MTLSKMKQKNDQIIDFFSSRLENAEMPLKRDLWSELEKELPCKSQHRLVPFVWASIAAVSVIVVAMGITLVMHHSINSTVPLNAESHGVESPEKSVSKSNLVAETSSKPMVVKDVHQKAAMGKAKKGDNIQADDSMVHVTVTIRQVEYGMMSHANNNNNSLRQSTLLADASNRSEMPEEDVKVQSNVETPASSWAATAYLSAHEDENLIYGVGIEKKISNRFSLVSGVTYSTADIKDQHKVQKFLGIPLKLKYDILDKGRLSLYSEAGLNVDQCVHNGSNTNVSLLASLGIQYKVGKNINIYTEPEIAYNVDNQSSIVTDKGQHLFSPGISCGIRLDY